MEETLETLYRRIKTRLRAAGIETADLEARLILEHRAGARWSDLIARPQTMIPAPVLTQIESDIHRREKSEPLSRIYGVREFGKLGFLLAPDTLDPRPDTETLIDAALRRFSKAPPRRILDLGTGTGCILISLLYEWPQSFGIGIDRAFGACATARINAQKADIATRTAFLCADWGTALSSSSAFFDLIVSNPPYIPSAEIRDLDDSVKNFDPILALDGGADGFSSFRSVITVIKNHLTEEGAAFVEIGAGQARDSARLVEEAGLNHIGQHADSSGIPRVVEMSRGDKCKIPLTVP